MRGDTDCYWELQNFFAAILEAHDPTKCEEAGNPDTDCCAGEDEAACADSFTLTWAATGSVDSVCWIQGGGWGGLWEDVYFEPGHGSSACPADDIGDRTCAYRYTCTPQAPTPAPTPALDSLQPLKAIQGFPLRMARGHSAWTMMHLQITKPLHTLLAMRTTHHRTARNACNASRRTIRATARMGAHCGTCWPTLLARGAKSAKMRTTQCWMGTRATPKPCTPSTQS